MSNQNNNSLLRVFKYIYYALIDISNQRMSSLELYVLHMVPENIICKIIMMYVHI